MADSKKVDNKKDTKAPEAKETDKKDASRNALFILISLLIIVFLIGLALIINRGLNTDNTINTTADNTGLINSDTNPPSNTTDNSTTPTAVPPVPPSPEPTPTPEPTPSSDGSVGTAASTESPEAASGAVLPTGHTEEGYKKSLANQLDINNKNLWFPTNYNVGDIPSINGKYTVQYGDTLWWIAQGHYGDPFQWTKIEVANFNLIGYLPDGSHALIFPGQIFDLP